MKKADAPSRTRPRFGLLTGQCGRCNPTTQPLFPLDQHGRGRDRKIRNGWTQPHRTSDVAPDSAIECCQAPHAPDIGRYWGPVLVADELDMAIEQLTPGQIECLLLVQQNLTSKEIAPRLGISPHTVDQRIRIALRTLGCKRRTHAAQLVASRTEPAALFQWPPPRPEPFVEYQVRLPVRSRRRPLPLPFATARYPRNEMSIQLRLLWIVGIACGAAFSMGVYLAGLESLARLIQN